MLSRFAGSTRNSVPFQRWTAFCAAWILLFASVVSPLAPVSAYAESIPSNRLALLLLKVIPYNGTWDDRSELRFFVLACGECGDLSAAQEFANQLVETNGKLREKETHRPSLRVQAGTVRELDAQLLSQDKPDVLFIMGPGQEDSSLLARLEALEKVAADLDILVLTDSREVFDAAGALFFTLGPNQQPEIRGYLERVEEQGAQLSGPIIRLIIWEKLNRGKRGVRR